MNNKKTSLLRYQFWLASIVFVFAIGLLPSSSWAHRSINHHATTANHHTNKHHVAAKHHIATKHHVVHVNHHSVTHVKAHPLPVSNASFIDALNQTRYWLNFRLRHERVDISKSPLQDAYATTLQTRVGFETGYYHYLNALVEGANISVIGPYHYNSGGGGSAAFKARYAIIADPNVTVLNRALVHFAAIPHSVITVGRQYINLDNQRFIGTVGFRQNVQRFDAVSGVTHLIPETTLFYAYVWQVNRIFGPNARSPFDKFNTGSQFINVNFHGLKCGDIIGYAYLLANNNAKTLSSKTFGIRFVGGLPLWSHADHHPVKLLYTAEIAQQKDSNGNPISYSENYYHVVGGLQVMSVAGHVGYEVLDGNGTVAFQTPYATLHKFNGWADLFLVTPVTGLADGYANVIVNNFMTLHATKLIAAYHDFHSRVGHRHYGDEYDVGLYHNFHHHLGVSVEYANFHGKTTGFPNVQKVWLTASANFASA